jgi:hypothetical protein
MPDTICPECGLRLGHFSPPGFCCQCGFRIDSVAGPAATEAQATPRWKGNWLPLGGAEIVGLFVFFIAKFNEAPFPIPTALGIGAMLVTFLLVVIVRKGVSPAAKLAREEGAVGMGKAVYQRVVKPILYGKKGSAR